MEYILKKYLIYNIISNIYSLFKLIKIFKFHYLFDKDIIISFYMNNKYNKPTFLL